MIWNFNKEWVLLPVPPWKAVLFNCGDLPVH